MNQIKTSQFLVLRKREIRQNLTDYFLKDIENGITEIRGENNKTMYLGSVVDKQLGLQPLNLTFKLQENEQQFSL